MATKLHSQRKRALIVTRTGRLKLLFLNNKNIFQLSTLLLLDPYLASLWNDYMLGMTKICPKARNCSQHPDLTGLFILKFRAFSPVLKLKYLGVIGSDNQIKGRQHRKYSGQIEWNYEYWGIWNLKQNGIRNKVELGRF